jgi:uncharacterized protein YjiS (DUF1127 family)
MSTHYIWLNSNPELQKHLRKASEARAATIYAAWKAIVRAVADPVRAVVELIRRANRVRATYRELSALSDHRLRDIGLSRSEISSVADMVAAASPEVGLTLADLRHARSVPSSSGSGSRVTPLPQRGQQQRSGRSRGERRAGEAARAAGRAAA